MSETRRVAVLGRHLSRNETAASPAASSAASTSSSSPSARATLDVDRLRRDYDEQGFVVVPGLFTADELELYRTRFEDICAGRVAPSQGMLVMKDVELAKRGGQIRSGDDCTKIQDFLFDPVFYDFARQQKLLDIVEIFIGDNQRAIHSMLINKPPDLGKGTSRHGQHQDILYFPLRPAERIVATWVAMEHVHRENGCLSVIPGSHKRPGRLLTHGYPEWEGGVNKLYLAVTEPIDLDARVHLEMQPGDCVFFHPLLIHGSGRNTTRGFRKAISCHYANGAACHWHPLRDSLLEEFVQGFSSMEQQEKDLLARQVWTNKSRQVRGEEHPRWHDEELAEAEAQRVREAGWQD